MELVEEATETLRGVKGFPSAVELAIDDRAVTGGRPFREVIGVVGWAIPKAEGVRGRSAGVRGAAKPLLIQREKWESGWVGVSGSPSISFPLRLLGGRLRSASCSALFIASSGVVTK